MCDHGTTLSSPRAAAVAARCELSCSQLRFERSARVVSPQITTSTPGVVMEPKAAQQMLLLSRFTSRTRPVGQAEALSIHVLRADDRRR